MSDYVVRFQLQSGNSNIESTVYSNGTPCSKSSAKAKLSELERQSERVHRDRVWERELSEAIGKAKRAIEQARAHDAQDTRNFYNTTFRYDGVEYRVDIAVERGKGHFSE